MRQNSKTFVVFILGLVVGALALYLGSNYTIQKKGNPNSETVASDSPNTSQTQTTSNPIDALTSENIVIKYVKEHHSLPNYYITKTEAKQYGWVPSKGNLCDVVPGKAIGGDRFGNREGHLPKSEQYYEADVNYHCGRRNADRIVFTKNGEVYLTKDHYKSFQKQ